LQDAALPKCPSLEWPLLSTNFLAKYLRRSFEKTKYSTKNHSTPSIEPSNSLSDKPSIYVAPSKRKSIEIEPSIKAAPSNTPSIEPSNSLSDQPSIYVAPSKRQSIEIEPSIRAAPSNTPSIEPSNSLSDQPSIYVAPWKRKSIEMNQVSGQLLRIHQVLSLQTH
jgi:hypothetical protein